MTISEPTNSDRAACAENAVIAALMKVVAALNTAPRFPVPSLDTDSYAIAAECAKVLAMAKAGAA